MRQFVAEALVDAASLVAIFFLLSLISVPQPFPFGAGRAPIIELTSGLAGVLVAAAILVLAERFVRPVIIAFTGRLLLSTFGLFMVVVNAIMIWVASLIAPDIATRGPAAAAVVPRGGRPLHALHHAGERGARPAPPAGAGHRGNPRDLAAARFAADAAPQPDPREPAPPADLRGRLLRHARRGPRPDAGRAPATVVYPGRPRRARTGPRIGSRPASASCCSSSGRPT